MEIRGLWQFPLANSLPWAFQQTWWVLNIRYGSHDLQITQKEASACQGTDRGILDFLSRDTEKICGAAQGTSLSSYLLMLPKTEHWKVSQCWWSLLEDREGLYQQHKKYIYWLPITEKKVCIAYGFTCHIPDQKALKLFQKRSLNNATIILELWFEDSVDRLRTASVLPVCEEANGLSGFKSLHMQLASFFCGPLSTATEMLSPC